MQKFDCLVAGNGLAGTLLAYFLAEEGLCIALVGEDSKSTSSRVAAGIIHPITGRRQVISWMAGTFIPFAEKTYVRCETLTGKQFYRQIKITELVREKKEWNDWTSHSNESGLSQYLSFPPGPPCPGKLQEFPHAVTVQGGCLNTPEFLDAMQVTFDEKIQVVRESFSGDDFVFDNDGVKYKSYQADRVIFCEGYKGMGNPFWNHLPWQPSKGEVLIIHCNDLQAQEILNRKIFILPLGDDLYKAGSTYAWEELNEIPTETAREKLISEIKKVLAVPFEVISQEAGVRPTVKERRPFLGMHPSQRRAGIFNGLGTKGVMSGPWLAAHLASHIVHDTSLLPEVDVARFQVQDIAP